MSELRPIYELVAEDLAGRHEVGLKTYGVPLTVETPIDTLQEAYSEALDLACYLRKLIEERA